MIGRKSKNLEAILWIILSCFTVASLNACSKIQLKYINVIELVFIHYFPIILVLIPCAFIRKYNCSSRLKFMNFLRALLLIVADVLLFYSLGKVSLPFSAALCTSSAIFSTLAGIMFLKERPSLTVWGGIFLGFLGMLLLIKPWNDYEFSLCSILILCSTICWAIYDVFTRVTGRDGQIEEQFFYLISYQCIGSFLLVVMCYFEFFPVEGQIIDMILNGNINIDYTFVFSSFLATASLALLLLSSHKAFSLAPIYVLTPFFFFSLVFSSIMGYFIFDEMVDLYDVVGAIIIIASSSFIAVVQSRNS